MSDASYRDAIFTTPLDRVASFSFDEQVVSCFPDMLRRSVPGYGQIIAMLGLMARAHLRPGARVYDLGCSLGAASMALAREMAPEDIEIEAVDLSAPMVERASRELADAFPAHRITVSQADIRTLDYQPAGMIVVNFTLQFLPPEDRDAVIDKLFAALEPGGVLILSEKIISDDPIENAWLIERYHDFKRANGYSDLEISQKREALEDVMKPDSLDTHHARLSRAGFARSHTWLQYLNFASMVAFKAAE